jgi:hypothetical protein
MLYTSNNIKICYLYIYPVFLTAVAIFRKPNDIRLCFLASVIYLRLISEAWRLDF